MKALQEIMFKNNINFGLWFKIIKTVFKKRFCGHKKREVLVSRAMVEVARVVFRYSFAFFLKKDFTSNSHFNFVIDQKSYKNECSINVTR